MEDISEGEVADIANDNDMETSNLFEVKDKWLIEYDFELKLKAGLEYFLGDILNKMIQINTSPETLAFGDNQTELLD